MPRMQQPNKSRLVTMSSPRQRQGVPRAAQEGIVSAATHHRDGAQQRAIHDVSCAFPVDELQQHAQHAVPDALLPHHMVPPQVQAQLRHRRPVLVLHIDPVHVLRAAHAPSRTALEAVTSMAAAAAHDAHPKHMQTLCAALHGMLEHYSRPPSTQSSLMVAHDVRVCTAEGDLMQSGPVAHHEDVPNHLHALVVVVPAQLQLS